MTKLSMNINDIAARQWDWVEAMGWHNKTVLEDLALIASEVGEAVNECSGKVPTANFAVELIDILLRTLEVAHNQGINIEEVLNAKMELNAKNGTRGKLV